MISSNPMRQLIRRMGGVAISRRPPLPAPTARRLPAQESVAGNDGDQQNGEHCQQAERPEARDQPAKQRKAAIGDAAWRMAHHGIDGMRSRAVVPHGPSQTEDEEGEHEAEKPASEDMENRFHLDLKTGNVLGVLLQLFPGSFHGIERDPHAHRLALRGDVVEAVGAFVAIQLLATDARQTCGQSEGKHEEPMEGGARQQGGEVGRGFHGSLA